MADITWIKTNYPGYAGWNDPAAIEADFKATGGAGKGGPTGGYSGGNSQGTGMKNPIDYGQIESARSRASTAAEEAARYTSGSYTIGDIIRKKAQEAYRDSQDIIQPLDQATATYLSSPATARDLYQNIWNPFSREKLVSQYVANQSLPMQSLSSILGQRFGRIEDTIGVGTRAYQAAGSMAQARAENERQNLSDLMSQYKLFQDEGEWLDLGNRKVKVDAAGNIIQSYPIGKVPSGDSNWWDDGGDGGGGEVNSWMATEPKPLFVPYERYVSQASPGGQWFWSAEDNDWIAYASLPPGFEPF